MAKVETLIGFAVKARKVIFGADRIEGNKSARLIICCHTLSERSLKNMLNMQTGKLKIIISKQPLEDIVFKTNCKAIAISDAQFAKAILDNLSNNFIVQE